jgi:hypothetical protein
MTPRQRVLSKYPRATVYVTGEEPRFAICVPSLRRHSPLSTQWLSNWHPTKKDAWSNAAFQMTAHQ